MTWVTVTSEPDVVSAGKVTSVVVRVIVDKAVDAEDSAALEVELFAVVSLCAKTEATKARKKMVNFMLFVLY